MPQGFTTFPFAIAVATAFSLAALPGQDQPAPDSMSASEVAETLAAVRAREAERASVIARVAPSVCSVMRMDSPGGGSGVVFDPTGFILTNYHVVGEPEKDGSYNRMKIGLPDGCLYEADVLGIDPGSDLAVLLLEPRAGGEPWPCSDLGVSGDVLVGEKVFAMGNPFLLATDFTPTVTFGVVSGTHRYQSGAANRMLVYPDCIQTDAPVNPGNSGGPLFTEEGKVIGINGRISINMERGRVNVGVGFAIAVDQAKNFLPDLMAGRHAEHGTMDLNAWFMTSREGSKKRGVFVQSLFRDSVAADHGVSLGDEILSFNGVPVRSANQLATMVGVLPERSWVVLVTRPTLADGGFGDEVETVMQLSRLDTGSSKELEAFDEGLRFATKEHRLIAAEALLRPLRDDAESLDDSGVSLSLETAPGELWTFRRLGDLFRADHQVKGKVVRRIVQDGAGVFVVDGESATAREGTVEEAAFMERHLLSNPLLFSASVLRERLDDAPLLGGVLVFGRAAARFSIQQAKDAPELETWLYLDGQPAGWSLRDPLSKHRLAYRIAHPNTRLVGREQPNPGVRRVRVERDSSLKPTILAATSLAVEVQASDFERPDS